MQSLEFILKVAHKKLIVDISSCYLLFISSQKS